ncbi:MAG: T9SS type A sorting domain-containing protein [Flavobacteriales bacterium]
MRLHTLALAALLSWSATAQWSIDPAAPMVVTNAANDQRYMRAIADADSGFYVFWSDLRNDPAKADLYGQHFDSEGNALWTANGELLMSHATWSFNNLSPLLMPDGSVIVCFLTRNTNINGDTARAMRFDANANMLWTEPTTLLAGSDFRSIQAVLSGSSAYVVAYCESCQGGYGCKLQRVSMDGTAQFPLPGGTTASSYYGPFTIHPDGVGGIMFNIRAGNGAGTPLKAQRYDSLGTAVWPGFIDLADATGLNYTFATGMDATRVQTVVWEVAGDLRMNRVDTLGASLWSPAVQTATDLPTYAQQDPSILVTNDALFVAWSDNRPPASNSDLYLQKYEPSLGAELWAADGIPVIQMNTFLPTTGMVPSDSGGVVVTIEGNIDGYSAMRVRSDGSLAWPDPVAFCEPSFNPYYAERVHLSDGLGGVVAFWQSFAGDLYGGRIYRNGKLYNDVGFAEADQASMTIAAYPSPAQDAITFELPASVRILAVELFDASGRRIGIAHTQRTLDIQTLNRGLYTARVLTSEGVRTSRFIKQ